MNNDGKQNDRMCSKKVEKVTSLAHKSASS